MNNELDKLGTPFTTLPELKWKFDIEAFEGPILSVLEDEGGPFYLEKWCSFTLDGIRTLVVPTTVILIKSYVNRKISMLDLLIKSHEDIGFLVDYVGQERKLVQLVHVSTLPDNYLPKSDAWHEEDLRPEDVDLEALIEAL